MRWFRPESLDQLGSIDRTTNTIRRRWRCPDCGVDSTNNTQRTIKDYLTQNSQETIEQNLRDWTAVKGVRVAYKMLRSARYKCLLTLGRRLRAEPVNP